MTDSSNDSFAASTPPSSLSSTPYPSNFEPAPLATTPPPQQVTATRTLASSTGADTSIGTGSPNSHASQLSSSKAGSGSISRSGGQTSSSQSSQSAHAACRDVQLDQTLDRATGSTGTNNHTHLSSSTSSGSNSVSSSTNNSPRTVVRKRHRFTSARLIDGGVIGITAGNVSLLGGPQDLVARLASSSPANSSSEPTSVPSSTTIPRTISAVSASHDRKGVSGECYVCISQHLADKQDCPVCRQGLARDQIFPNFTLNDFLQERETHPRSRLRHDLLQAEYTCEDIDEMVSALTAKKRELKARDQQVELEVLLDFLRNTRTEKEDALARLNAQIHCLDSDMRKVQEKLDALKQQAGYQNSFGVVDDDEDQIEHGIAGGAQVPNEASEEEDEAVPPQQAGSKRSRTQLELDEKADAVSPGNAPVDSSQTHVAKRINVNKKRVAEHFEDLQRCYFDFSQSSSARRESALSSFCSTISKFTKFSRFEHINTLRYGDIFNSSSIVSSIEFDRDDEYFATAGVTKKIKIFEYGCIEKTGLMGTSQKEEDHMDLFDAPNIPANKKPITSVLHYPVLEMVCRSKISCLSWNSYIKSQIASSDYEAWSVDFSRTDPTQLASGSDDTKVKIWSVNQRSSVCTIESKANICCVKFNPESSHHIAFGSADHHIHYYDLRKATVPLFVFKGHRKAVSYVKFLGRDELVSASTDSTLKLWNTSRMTCARTYTGHCNEKNFVGLSASGDWISCGSENNSVYTYYKELRDPVVTVKFGNSNPVTGEDSLEEDPSQFVSSVCWKKDTSSNILLAANSSGVIKVLQLV
ncbi:RING finger and WD repeat domain-containing protein 2 [Podila epicladia]|nr:RING finger and WD repeat domain-containing protein 2 [Podila epicladia]